VTRSYDVTAGASSVLSLGSHDAELGRDGRGSVTGSTFTGWSGGGCSGTGTCTVMIDAAKTVTATFSP